MGGSRSFASAEAFLCTVVGVSRARIIAHPAGGVAIIRVHCSEEATPGQIVRNIRSALFAGFGIAISAECIEFVEAAVVDDPSSSEGVELCAATHSAPMSTAGAVPEAAVMSMSFTKRNHERESDPRGSDHRGSDDRRDPDDRRTAKQRPLSEVAAVLLPTPGAEMLRTAATRVVTIDRTLLQAGTVTGRETEARADVVAAVAAAATAGPSPASAAKMDSPATAAPKAEPGAVGASVRDLVASAAALRLESVEIRRQSGRLRCRVVISLGTDHFGAVADSSDGNAGEIHLAGRVACDALRAGGFTDARYDGAALAHINGREHVVVALNQWTDGETVILSGAAPLDDPPERAAAIATIKAVLAQDIN
jgi:hypothetical protein